jgi:hypothetical protein
MAGCHSLPVQAVGGRGGGCIGDPCWVSVEENDDIGPIPLIDVDPV